MVAMPATMRAASTSNDAPHTTRDRSSQRERG
jgi:hypothetical protein